MFVFPRKSRARGRGSGGDGTVLSPLAKFSFHPERPQLACSYWWINWSRPKNKVTFPPSEAKASCFFQRLHFERSGIAGRPRFRPAEEARSRAQRNREADQAGSGGAPARPPRSAPPCAAAGLAASTRSPGGGNRAAGGEQPPALPAREVGEPPLPPPNPHADPGSAPTRGRATARPSGSGGGGGSTRALRPPREAEAAAQATGGEAGLVLRG